MLAQGFGTILTLTLTLGMVTYKPHTVKSFSGLLVTRFFLGLAEAGIFPGSKFRTSSFRAPQPNVT
jgi:hypothetical protein